MNGQPSQDFLQQALLRSDKRIAVGREDLLRQGRIQVASSDGHSTRQEATGAGMSLDHTRSDEPECLELAPQVAETRIGLSETLLAGEGSWDIESDFLPPTGILRPQGAEPWGALHHRDETADWVEDEASNPIRDIESPVSIFNTHIEKPDPCRETLDEVERILWNLIRGDQQTGSFGLLVLEAAIRACPKEVHALLKRSPKRPARWVPTRAWILTFARLQEFLSANIKQIDRILGPKERRGRRLVDPRTGKVIDLQEVPGLLDYLEGLAAAVKVDGGISKDDKEYLGKHIAAAIGFLRENNIPAANGATEKVLQALREMRDRK